MDKGTMKKRTKGSALFALLAAFAVLVSGAFSPLTPTASADTTTANTLAELKTQINNASGARTITLGNDIAWDGNSITIPAGKDITIDGDHTIFRDKNATKLNSMFDVKGTLTLDGKVKLSGKTGSCAGPQTTTPKVSGPFGGELPKITHDKFWQEWPADQKFAPFKGKNQRVMIGFPDIDRPIAGADMPGVAYQYGDGRLFMTAEENVFEGVTEVPYPGRESENFKVRRAYLKQGIDVNKYVFTIVDIMDDEWQAGYFKTTDGRYLGRPQGGNMAAVQIVDKNASGYFPIETQANSDLIGLKFQIPGPNWSVEKFIVPNKNDANPVVVQALAGAQTYTHGRPASYLWLETEGWYVEGATNSDGSKKAFTSLAAAQQWAQDHTSPRYWTVEGTDEHFDTQAAAQQWANQHATTTPGGCTLDNTCSKITTAMFNGSKGNEKGYFVQVSGNGVFNLQGNAELSNFLTGPNVSYVAPVVAKGGTVNIKGGKIHDNSAGYNADDSKNQQGAKQIQTYIEKNLAHTETAGAVMYLGGAKGAITGGTIENNRGDTGGILVEGEGTSVTMDGGAINKNVGIHYGGAAYVHFGGSLVMAGSATMNNNYAWDRGGAVYVSSQDYASSIVWPVIDPKEYKPATFVMDGNAVMSGNYAVNRAGAVFVESHDVMLKSGQITGNFSRSLGGAIYVVGDGDKRMYQLYVPNACVTGNTAVKGGVNAGPLNKALPNSTGDTCTVNNNLQSTGLLQGDTVDFAGHEGFGGGVWLCAFGGNATFGSGKDAQGNNANVVVAGNSAQPKQGADMHLRPTKPGAGSGINVLNNYSDDHWVNEVNNKQILVNQVYTGPLNVKNTGSAQCSGSMKISGNYARVGGGIASDGTVVFGPAKDIYRVHGKLDVTKTWENVPEKDRKAIDLQLGVKDGNTTYPLEGYKIRLDGKADVFDNENELQENDGKYNNESPAWESTPWNGTFGLPLVYTDNAGNTKPVLTFKDPDNASRTLNPAEPEDLPRLYELIKAKRLGTGNLTASLTIIETINGQAPTEYVYSEKDVTLNVDSSATDSKTLAEKTYKDRSGKVIGTVKTNKLALNMHKDISNTIPDEEPTVEKYVNQKVHDEIEFFDKEFTYDVMAYVPKDATSVTITDTLVEGLEFADANGKPTKAALSTIQRIAYRSTNDHTPGGSVAAAPEGTLAVSNQTVGIANGNKLVVTIDKATPLNKIKGKWVQVTFKARIKDTYRTIDALKAAGWATEDVNKQGAIPGPDAPIVAALNTMIAPNYDTVVRAIEGPSRLFALTQDGKYYATPMNDKSGKTWVAPSAGDDFTANAASRFNGTATNNVRELVLKATPSDQKANWPVQSDEAHEGMANKAIYTAVSPRNGGEYETNTVTVKPKTTELKVAKRWNVNGSDAWPNNVQKVTFGIFDNTGKQVTTVDLTKAEPTKTVTGLAKLQGVTYSAKEISVTTTDGKVTQVSNTGDNGLAKISDMLSFIAKVIKDAETYVALNEAPEVEKYVNNNVHADLEGFDDVFEYSVLAYVPQGATKVEITDTLTNDLVFVDLNGNVQKIKNDAGEVIENPAFDASKLITNSTGMKKFDLVIEPNNNHQVNGVVKGHSDVGWYSNHPERHVNGPIRNNGVKLSDDGKTITVTVNEGELTANPANTKQVDAHGKWIVLSFRATINPDSYDKVVDQIKAGDDPSVADLSWQKITDDKTVTGGSKPHAGLDNTAKYKVFVGNEGSSDYETNTVTVKPKPTSVTATKAWLDAKGQTLPWPTGVEVTVKVLRSDTNAEVGALTLTEANPKATLEDLPMLEGVTYVVEEVPIDGFLQAGEVTGTGTKDDPYVLTNQKVGGPRIEKYVNNGVHENLEGFDTSFKYDIIAFVPEDADEIVINDTLVDVLEFAKAPDDGALSNQQTAAAVASTDPGEVVTRIAVKDENNHQVGTKPAQYPNATVLTDGVDVSDQATVDINGKDLIVSFGSETTPITDADGLRGKYVQITFWAKYTDQTIARLNEILASDNPDGELLIETINGNGAIIGGMVKHTGTPNDAFYDVRVGNDWTKKIKSNTVTVKGKDTQLEATKQWQNADGSTAGWPEGVEKVEINVLKNGDKEAVVDTIVLNADSAIGKSKKLPKLVGVEYTLDEVAVPGYITTRNGNTFVNKDVGKPQIEKYINKDVDAHLSEYDRHFTYDIMAFVPHNAEAITINDSLVESLEFANASGEASSVKTDVVSSVVVKDANDHKAKGTVSSTDGTPLNVADVATIDGKNLKVEIANAEAYRGKWIQVTFYAKYTQAAIDNAIATPVPDNADVKDNGSVISSIKTHDGTANTASYTLKINGEWSSEYKSNTVTHDAETVTVEAEKQWQNADNSTAEWPSDVAEVKVDVLNGDKVVDTITLTAAQPKGTSKELPKLIGVDYTLAEVAVPGYQTTRDGNIFINKDVGKPQIEKYINKDVDAHLVEYDKVIEYDIMAFVPFDAEAITITDPLVDSLEFAKADGTASTVPSEVVSSVVAKATNDHTALTGTVVSTDGTPLGDAAAISFADEGKRLNVEIADATAYRGKWIQVTFYAKYIQAAIDNAIATPVPDNADVKDNGSVISSIKTHDGTANTASYTLKINGEWSSEYKSNTVTHDAETVTVEAEKQWQNADNSTAEWPSDVAEVKVDVLNGDKVVDTITLTAAKPKASSKELPKLTGVTYKIVEADVPAGYTSTVEGQVVVNKAKTYPVEFSKREFGVDTEELEGAKIKVTDSEGNVVDEWTSSADGPHTLNLEAGEYTFEEVNAPAGFEKITTTITFTVDTDGKVTLKEAYENINGKVSVKDTNHLILEDMPEAPAIEKYVNKDVHQDLVEFDRTFVYDVMVYVSGNAASAEIYDTLVGDLEFAVAGEDRTTAHVAGGDTKKVVTSVVVKDTNDHKADGTVKSTDGTPVDYTAEIDGKNLKVIVTDIAAARGKWLQVTFSARIMDENRLMDDLATELITDNGTVISEKFPTHNGVPNTASYLLFNAKGDALQSFVDDEGNSKPKESNTVTVVPETVTVNAEKQWQKADGTPAEWPSDVAEVKINVLNGTEVVDTITLTSAQPKASSKELPKLIGVTYKLDESTAVPGYESTVNGSVVVNKAYIHDVIFSKYEFGETAELAGAKIKVTDSEGNVVDEWTSSADGPHIMHLEAGEYTFEEVNAPEGFGKITTTVTFTVDTTGTVSVSEAYENINGKVSVVDTNHLILEDIPLRYVSITVAKEWLNAEGWEQTKPAAWPAGVEVTVNIKDGDKIVRTVTLNAAKPSVEIADLPQLPDRDYTVEEVAVDGVYVLQDGLVTVAEDENGKAVTLVNRLLPKRSERSVEVVKVDENGEAVAGATLKVTGVDADGNPIDLGSDGEWTTDGTSHLLSHILPGTYTLEETGVPQGYMKADPITFEVSLEGVVTVGGTVVALPVITMIDKKKPPVDVPTPTPSETSSPTTSPTPQTAKPNKVTPRSLVRTGAPAGISLVMAFTLMGAGTAALIMRRRMS